MSIVYFNFLWITHLDTLAVLIPYVVAYTNTIIG
jgi:hypothetical protein